MPYTDDIENLESARSLPPIMEHHENFSKTSNTTKPFRARAVDLDSRWSVDFHNSASKFSDGSMSPFSSTSNLFGSSSGGSWKPGFKLTREALKRPPATTIKLTYFSMKDRSRSKDGNDVEMLTLQPAQKVNKTTPITSPSPCGSSTNSHRSIQRSPGRKWVFEAGVITHEEQLMDIIKNLEDSRKGWERDGNYLQASIVAKQIQALKIFLENKKRTSMLDIHTREKEAAEAAYKAELSEKNKLWSERFKVFQNEVIQHAQYLKQQHVVALENFRAKMDTRVPKKPQSSRDLLNERKVQTFLGKQGKYLEAQRVKRQADRKEMEELQATRAAYQLKVKEQLVGAEKRKETALHELAEAKKKLEIVTAKSKETSESTVTAVTDADNKEKLEEVAKVEEKHDLQQVQSTVPFEEHKTAEETLESLKQKLADLKAELLTAEMEREASLKQKEEALATEAANVQKAEALSKELAEMNESFVLLKLACIAANKDKVALLQAKQADKPSEVQEDSGLELANEELKKAELEHKLAAATMELGELQSELTNVKQGEASATREATSALEAVVSELDRTRLSEESAASSLQSFSAELEETKAKLRQELENVSNLTTILESLKKESEMVNAELKSVREREANATAASSVLTIELGRLRADLPIAQAAEAKAVESISGLSQTFEQVKVEAAEAKAEAEMLEKEAAKIKNEADEAKAAKEKAETMLQSALEEVRLAKEAEAAAIGQLKALSMKTYESRASEVGPGAEITISKDEYDAMKRKVQEAEELANMRVAAAIAQVEAVKASEQEILHKVAIAIEDMDNVKAAIKQAQQRAEMAEAAKSAVESELKRLREREQKRKETTPTASQQLFFKGGNEGGESTTDMKSQEPPSNTVISSKEEGPKPQSRHENSKKKPFLGSFLSKRKSFSGKSA